MHSAWGPYAETVLRFPEVKLAIDLRLPLPAAIPKRLSQLGLTGSFGVVTACNPRGITLDAGANRRLTAELAAVVRERYPAARLAQGESPDGRHEEAGWAIAAPLPELKRLAAEFRQNALFWFDGVRFVIVPVLGQGPPLPLPAARPR